MPAIRLSPFGGMVPAVDARLIPDTAAADASDAWLYSGAAVGFPSLKTLYTNTSNATTKVYRIPRKYNDSTHLSDSIWMEFTDIDTDVIKSMVLGDAYERYYWASPTTVPRYNTRARIEAGQPSFLLGVTQANQPTVSSSGGSGTQTSRAYLTTWVTAYGEEGPASTPSSLVNGYPNSTWLIGLTPPLASDMGTDRNIVTTRIYRTITGTDGTTTYFFVKDVPATTTSTTDTDADTLVSARGQLVSTNWTGPPSDLQGFVTLANGMVVGFRSNEVWFCEPFRMHAWPVAYTLPVEYPVIGLGVSNQTLVIMTSGYPYIGSGTSPSSFLITKLSGLLPCTARGSIVSSTEGVYYSSPQGLALVSSAGIAVVTRDLIKKDKWGAIVPTGTLRAVKLGAGYYAYGSSRPGVFETTAFETTAFTQVDYSGARAGVFVDPTSQTVAFGRLTSVDPIVNMMTDPWSGEIFIIKGTTTYWLDIGDVNQPRESFFWASKIFQTSAPDNFKAMKVFWDTPIYTPKVFSQGQFTNVIGVVQLYADGRLVFERSLLKSGEMWRLPAGFKANFWQIQITATVQISSVQCATSVEELKGV